jgi:RNA polymerase sigma factor (sigma-70 family)
VDPLLGTMTPSESKLSAETLLLEMTWLRGLARSLVMDSSAAEDVLQDTWLIALQRKPPGLGGGRLRAWLTTVARNVARRRFRDEATRRGHEEDSVDTAQVSVSDEVERLRLQRLVAEHVLRLREPYRTAVLLRFQEGLSYGDMATRLKVREETVRQRVSRGLALLRELLDAHFKGDRPAWCLALAPLTKTGGPGPLGTTLTLGGIAMGTKLALAAAALVLVVVGLQIWKGTSEGVTATASAEAPAVLTLEEPIEEAPVNEVHGSTSERLAVPLDPPTEVVGALATADAERDLQGRVIDPQGNPVAGARITLRRDDVGEYSVLDLTRDSSGELIAELESDSLGEFAIPLDAGRPSTLRVEKQGFAPAVRLDRYAGEYLEVRLGLGATLSGRVVRAEDGEGLQARIRGRQTRIGSLEIFDELTDAEGFFTIGGLDASTVRIDVMPEDASRPKLMDVQLVAGEVVEQVIECEAGFALRGRVSDARNGAPVVGAEVSEGWTFQHTIRTDERGEFLMENIRREGVYDVAVRAAGFGRQKLKLTPIVDGFVTLNFELVPGRRVLGRIVDARGSPVADAYVAAVASSFENRMQKLDWLSTRSRADGEFEIVDLRPDARHVLYVLREGLGAVIYDFPDNEHDLTTIELGAVALQDPLGLRGVVIGPSGEPAVDCRVELKGVNDNRGLLGGTPVEGIEAYCGRRDARTDHRGRFSFSDLAVGEYRLAARQVDSRWHTKEVVIDGADGIQEVEIKLPEGMVVGGQVFGTEGELVGDIFVQVEPMEGTPGPGGHDFVDADGQFRMAGLRKGFFRLEAIPMDAAQQGRGTMLSTVMEVASGSESLEIHMPAALRISGHVFDADGRPVMSATVRAIDRAGEMAALSRTTEDGSFVLALEGGLGELDLVATPPPTEGPFYDYASVDPAAAAHLKGVAAETEGLLILLPAR